MNHGAQVTENRRQVTEIRGQMSEVSRCKMLNIEQQNKEPQNYEVITSIFEIPCSIFCGSDRGLLMFNSQITHLD